MGKAVWRMNCPTHIQWCSKEGGKSRKQSERKLEADWGRYPDPAVRCTNKAFNESAWIYCAHRMSLVSIFVWQPVVYCVPLTLPPHFFGTQAVDYVHWSEEQTETSIVSSGTLSPALRLSQHFMSSNLLIEPMDYEQHRIVSRFLALLPEHLQQTPLSSVMEKRGGYMDRMHRQRKSPCLSFDMYISNHFLNRIFSPSPHQMPLSFTRSRSPFYWGSVCVFASSFYVSVETSNMALICFSLAFWFLLVLVLLFQVFHIINIQGDSLPLHLNTLCLLFIFFLVFLTFYHIHCTTWNHFSCLNVQRPLNVPIFHSTCYCVRN